MKVGSVPPKRLPSRTVVLIAIAFVCASLNFYLRFFTPYTTLFGTIVGFASPILTIAAALVIMRDVRWTR